MAAKQTIRLAYSDLVKMIALLDKTGLVEDKDKANLLVSYESNGIGATVDLTIEGAIVMDVKTNVTIPISDFNDW